MRAFVDGLTVGTLANDQESISVKTCAVCGEKRFEEDFYLAGTRPGYRRTECKRCSRAKAYLREFGLTVEG